MNLPAIAYVDEKEDEAANFFNDARDSGFFSDVFIVPPSENMAETIDELLGLPIDAFISDYNLSEAVHMPYTGEQLVEAFLAHRHGFPCFIRTAFEPLALKDAFDVNIIYPKSESTAEDEQRPLLDRVRRQIERVKKAQAAAQKELLVLLNIPSTERDAQQIDRIAELDNQLEAYLGGDKKIPQHLKSNLFAERDDLIRSTEELVVKIKKELDN